MEEKGRLLKSQIGVILDTASLNKSWDELELRLSAHEKNVEEQKDRLRALIEKRIKDFKVEIEKFAARWRGSKPDASGLKDRESATAILEEVGGDEFRYLWYWICMYMRMLVGMRVCTCAYGYDRTCV